MTAYGRKQPAKHLDSFLSERSLSVKAGIRHASGATTTATHNNVPEWGLAREVALFGDVTEIFDEFHFETCRVDEIGILAEGFIGTFLVDRETGRSQSLDDRVDIAGDEGKMGQAGLMTNEVPIVSVAVVVEGQILIVIAKVQPLAVLAVPLAFTVIANPPVRKGRLIERQG